MTYQKKIKQVRKKLEKSLIVSKDVNIRKKKVKASKSKNLASKNKSTKNSKPSKNKSTKNSKPSKNKTKKINLVSKIKNHQSKQNKNKTKNKSISNSKSTHKDNNNTKAKNSKNKKSKLQFTNIKVLSKPLCDTCVNVKVKNTAQYMSTSEEKWKDFPFHIPVLGRKNGSQCVEIDFGKENANRLVYYFGANESIMQHTSIYPYSYKNSKNNGLVFLDKKGCATIHLNCPQNYKDIPLKGSGLECKDKNGKTVKNQGYMNHIHMIISNKNMDGWLNKLHTTNVVCKINKQIYNIHKANKTRIIINSIESKYNIDGTNMNIVYNDIKNKKNVSSLLRKQIKTEALKHDKFKKIIKNPNKCSPNPVIEIPLIVYCHNPECHASKDLIDLLYKAGFHNILYYPGGFMDYTGRS